ncbi:hypothetical protein P152DRAFT_402384 [Eremomyces bilateralis CBS 781.70]|uniref:Cupin type-1 domain-containing protein n=1 Tax=Eremomyces bilateralis CBS 781.70 TaxID=1392243 RepID=A0A6G1FVF8_9PEZI|nr:uncharacterized protein P152DRAFT_402384 [Eremomyces bilateralis CBS 781.70]KAF1809885.1 hypothetical protein P152DRAFT_402384 [Eremomyces bilateralis CBS 781.70]
MAASEDTRAPQLLFVNPTPHVPNSHLPVLFYRSVFENVNEEAIRTAIEKHGWMKGGQWGTYKVPHFHTTTHECYAVLKGKCSYGLGRSPLDQGQGEDKGTGKVIQITQGDVFVLPAGVSHAAIESEDEFEYAGFYPEGSVEYDMNFCEGSPGETEKKAANSAKVPVPKTDPVYGESGPLPGIWSEVDRNRG